MIIILEEKDLQKKPKNGIRDADYNYTLTRKIFEKASSVYVTDGKKMKTLKAYKRLPFEKNNIHSAAELLNCIMNELKLNFSKSVNIMARSVTPKVIARTLTEIERDGFERS